MCGGTPHIRTLCVGEPPTSGHCMGDSPNVWMGDSPTRIPHGSKYGGLPHITGVDGPLYNLVIPGGQPFMGMWLVLRVAYVVI